MSTGRMSRRGLLASAALGIGAPFAHAQGRPRRLGVLLPLAADDPVARKRAAALVRGLAERGWREGGTLIIDWRWTGDDSALLDRAATGLVAAKPDVLLAAGSPAVVAVNRQASRIPLVFTAVTDPVAQSFVASLARPGGTVTGFSDYDAPMAGKWIEALATIAPGVRRVAALYNRQTAPFADLMLRTLSDAAASVGRKVIALPVEAEGGIATELAAFAREPGGGVVVLPDFFTSVHRLGIVTAMARLRLPAVYWSRSFVADGGLMSYGTDITELFGRAADYIDRILKGAKPADLPVQEPVKFEFVLNQKTARALGLALSPLLLASADEVIE